MKRLFWRFAPEVVLGLALFTAGCDPSHNVPAGPPQLVSFSLVSNASGQPLDITSDGGLTPVNGFAHLYAVFDRLLDSIPVTGYDGGMDFGADDDQIKVAPEAAGAGVTYTSIYTPNGDSTLTLVFPAGPSIITSPTPTFPSGATITATLDRNKIRSKKGEPFEGGAMLMFQTLPFAGDIAVPVGDMDPDGGADAGLLPVVPQMQPVTITFSNLP